MKKWYICILGFDYFFNLCSFYEGAVASFDSVTQTHKVKDFIMSRHVFKISFPHNPSLVICFYFFWLFMAPKLSSLKITHGGNMILVLK